MAKAHRAIQQWNRWLTEPLGMNLLEAEKQFLPAFLADCYGQYSLLIGVPEQYSLLKLSTIQHKVLLSPLINKNNTIHFVEAEYYELPIATASVDLVFLPHSLEYVDNPQQLLSEACRVVKPEGHIVILGFNPYSLWGLKKRFSSHPLVPWSRHFLTAGCIKDWLKLADFELLKHTHVLFRPPLQHHDALFKKLKIMEWLGGKIWPSFGGVYLLLAKAKVIPLTPIKLHWRQELSGVHIPVPGGPTIRNS